MTFVWWVLGILGTAAAILAAATFLRRERAGIRFFKAEYAGVAHLIVEVINRGHFPLFIREVKIELRHRGGGVLPLETRDPGPEEVPIRPGGSGIYKRSEKDQPPIDIDKLPGSGTRVIVWSNIRVIARKEIPAGPLEVIGPETPRSAEPLAAWRDPGKIDLSPWEWVFRRISRR